MQSKSNRLALLEKYKGLKRPLILDGAMGSLLQQKGIPGDKHLWFSKLNIDNPKLVIEIHKEYIDAGADIITTNTFRTNPASLKASNYSFDQSKFVFRSVQIAIEAREDKEIIIAGSNAPAEDCYHKERTISMYELDYNHKKHIELLWENGVDVLWHETQSHWDEIEIISKFCSYNSLPFVMNFYFNDDLKLLSGEPLSEAVDFAKEFSPVAIGFNCIKPDIFRKYFEKHEIGYNWGFYFNCGAGNVSDNYIHCGIDPTKYTEIIRQYLNYKPVFIGSCCGSSPLHTQTIKDFFDEIY